LSNVIFETIDKIISFIKAFWQAQTVDIIFIAVDRDLSLARETQRIKCHSELVLFGVVSSINTPTCKQPEEIPSAQSIEQASLQQDRRSWSLPA
jgi:hypothetical protein